jgi:hypothetical protein
MEINNRKRKYPLPKGAIVQNVVIDNTARKPDQYSIVICHIRPDQFFNLPRGLKGIPSFFTIIEGDMMFYPQPSEPMTARVRYILEREL